jgi:osmotically-inducible protein OsmY
MKSDTRLQHDVLVELEWDPGVDAAQVGVAAKDGVVTLTGTVPSYAEKVKAERAAKRVHGVRGLANDIAVRVRGADRRTDADIADAAVRALEWDTGVPDDRITVVVRDGWLTLEGDMDWWHQREAAERAVRPLAGLEGVTNQVVVKPRVGPGDVKGKIEEAFRRSAAVDAGQVRVEVEDGKVTLHGGVRSLAEVREAERAAWAAPGVSEVDNRLAVMP